MKLQYYSLENVIEYITNFQAPLRDCKFLFCLHVHFQQVTNNAKASERQKKSITTIAFLVQLRVNMFTESSKLSIGVIEML